MSERSLSLEYYSSAYVRMAAVMYGVLEAETQWRRPVEELLSNIGYPEIDRDMTVSALGQSLMSFVMKISSPLTRKLLNRSGSVIMGNETSH